MVSECGSPKTVVADSKLTRCLVKFDLALFASHSKVSTPEIQASFNLLVYLKLIGSAIAFYVPVLRSALCFSWVMKSR